MKFARNHQAGFTLVEVLVALAILSIALAATMRASAMATTTANEIKIKTYATWVAQNQIAELTARKAFPATGETSGLAVMAGVNFQWRQTSNDTPNKDFRKVEIAVSLVGDDHKHATLIAYLSLGGS